MVLDCSAAGSAEFTPAATDPGPVPEDPGGTIRGRSVPEHTIRLRPPNPSETGANECLDTTLIPVGIPWILRAGAAAEGIRLSHGSTLLIDTEGFSGEVHPELVDTSGRRMAIDDTSTGFKLYVDPQLPPGRYFVEARSGEQVGTGTVEISRSSQLQLVRRSVTPHRYDIVGGAGSIDLAIYRWAPDACDEDPQLWQDAGTLELSDGVGRLTITTTGAARGTYCLAVRNQPNPVDQCNISERKLLI